MQSSPNSLRNPIPGQKNTLNVSLSHIFEIETKNMAAIPDRRSTAVTIVTTLEFSIIASVANIFWWWKSLEAVPEVLTTYFQ